MPANYRPISLTCTCCKMLEHIILKFITEFVETNQILHPNQHGFRSGLSTVTQLVEIAHDLAQALNNQSQIDMLFLDFSKAFDRVSHAKLIFKLKNILGDGPVTCWVSDYLSNRKQFVHLGDHSSDSIPVVSGVPQGTVLAPLLFLLYINDIAKEVNVKIRLFADDCVLYQEIVNIEDQIKLNNALAQIGQWCKDWQMSINSEKTVSMTVTKKKRKLVYPYSINNAIIPSVSEHRYLGLIISSDLTWTAHIQQVTRKAMQKLFFLKRILRHSTFETKHLAYVTLIRPILEYANVVWFPHTKNNIHTLEMIQRKAVRFLYNRYKRTDSPTELSQCAGLHTLASRAKLQRLKFLYMLLHNSFKLNYSDFINIKSTRQTRQMHPHRIEEFSCNNNAFLFSYFPQAVREWNELNPCVTAQTTFPKFVELAEKAVLSFTY